MKTLHVVSFLLVALGALNWGLIGLFGFNVISSVFGASLFLTRLVYILVGLGGLFLVLNHKKECRNCFRK
ncbi:DUF378 domain-containing protein [Patescibacteria group bacterium]|nr:DUF378 domain-containing protein [Patescibacteria group bacterium]MCL5010286.1 DUF378 domain-containing protein [Patescibacteria group bacterium]